MEQSSVDPEFRRIMHRNHTYDDWRRLYRLLHGLSPEGGDNDDQ